MDMKVLFAEWAGDIFLILFGGGVVANVVLSKSKGQGGGWIVITAGWGFAVMIAIFIAQALGSPQADLNPAVTLAKYFLGTYSKFYYVVSISLVQIAGCFSGAILVWSIYYPHFEATELADLKLAVFCTSPAIFYWPSNLFCEIVATFVLVFSIGAMVQGHTIASGLLPYFIGILVWAIGLSLGGATGYAINPARDLGPRLAYSLLPISKKESREWHYAWIPIIGPLIGAAVAGILWKILL